MGTSPMNKRRFRGPLPALTTAQARRVVCPRCRAAVGDPCRDQRGKAVSSSHADRVRVAARRLPASARTPKPPPPVPITAVRPLPAPDPFAAAARGRDEDALRSRGLRAVSAASAVSRTGESGCRVPALLVPCPVCGEAAGGQCRRPDRKARPPHPQRVALAAASADGPAPAKGPATAEERPPVGGAPAPTGRSAGRKAAARGAPEAGVPEQRGAVRAAFAGTCPVCMRHFDRGTEVQRVGNGWGHAACAAPGRAAAEFRRNKAAIEAGATFRGRKPSTWRRGTSPSSSRTDR